MTCGSTNFLILAAIAWRCAGQILHSSTTASSSAVARRLPTPQSGASNDLQHRSSDPVQPWQRNDPAQPFLLLPVGLAGCAESEAISSVEECRQAFAHFHVLARSQWVGARKSLPAGCSMEGSVLLFNKVKSGKGSSKAMPVCRSPLRARAKAQEAAIAEARAEEARRGGLAHDERGGGESWRNDGRCGVLGLARDGSPGKCPTPAQFDAEASSPQRADAVAWLRDAPCCAASGWCGRGLAHCSCSACVDYRHAEGVSPLRAPQLRYLSARFPVMSREALQGALDAAQGRLSRALLALGNDGRDTASPDVSESSPLMDDKKAHASFASSTPPPTLSATMLTRQPGDNSGEPLAAESTTSYMKWSATGQIGLFCVFCVAGACAVQLVRRIRHARLSQKMKCGAFVTCGASVVVALSLYCAWFLRSFGAHLADAEDAQTGREQRRSPQLEPGVTIAASTSASPVVVAELNETLDASSSSRYVFRVAVPGKSSCDIGLLFAGMPASCEDCARFYDGRPGYRNDAYGACEYAPTLGICITAGWVQKLELMSWERCARDAEFQLQSEQHAQMALPTVRTYRQDGLGETSAEGQKLASGPASVDYSDLERGMVPALPQRSRSARNVNCKRFRHIVVPLDFGAYGDGRSDDTAAVKDTLLFGTECQKIVEIGPAGRIFLVQPGELSLELHGLTLRFTGTLVGPALDVWNPMLEGWPKGSCAYGEINCKSKEVGSPELQRSRWNLLHLRNSTDLILEGPGGLHAPGLSFWKVRNLQPGVRGYCLLKIERSSNISISRLRLANSPMYQLVIMKSTNVDITELVVELEDSSVGDVGPHNTDGVSIVGSRNVSLRNCEIASGDDNVVIKEGSSRVFGERLVLSRGKGISIGSLGEQGSSGQIVADIYFGQVTLLRSMHGVRVKTWLGGFGLVRNLTFEDFRFVDVRTAVLIDQHYCPRSQKPEGCGEDANFVSAVAIRNVRFRNFSGTVLQPHRIDCQSCSRFAFDGAFLAERSHAPAQRCDCCCGSAALPDTRGFEFWDPESWLPDDQVSEIEAAARSWMQMQSSRILHNTG
eukprot:TRINITY_DN13728_c0_g2_i1.p1 TRINITY_DN13728_c0_g2~~TRINITY_DN13728_c0_g2_i1.p1  ORF type:complete len:1062 (+),score=172.60 TRINITY_DN13728_c0_g2_i1:142-3327(+)